jgi:hypothetical protein
VTELPFRMDPNAHFHDEVARIARENNADVAFKLVDREDGSMEPHDCELHDHTATYRAERYTFTITHSDGKVTQVVVCKEHGEWVHARGPGERIPPHSDRRAIEKLRPQLQDRNNRLSQGVRMREPIDRGPGGGPGGRSMAPDRPAHIPPPPEKIDRTYPPPSDPNGGRLVIGSVSLLPSVGRPPRISHA